MTRMDDELNGGTDDEDMEDGEMNIRDPGQPTAKELQEHMATHRPYRSWCKFFVMGRGVNAPHRRSDAQDDMEGGAARVNGLWVPRSEGIGRAGVPCAGHPRTETQDDVGNAGSEKANGVPLDRKESGEVR